MGGVQAVAAVMFLLGCGPTSEQSAEEARAALEMDDWRKFEEVLGKAPSDDARDLIRLDVAVALPGRAELLCRGVKSAVATQRCQAILTRPHITGPRQE